jgi:beta-alanine--pyruvate transaminase
MTQAPANDLSAYWMPFTPNKAFKAAPRLFVAAEGQFYFTADGRKVRDGFSGLWCSGLGHCHPRIAEAIAAQARRLDYSPAFNFATPDAFRLATEIADQFPGALNHVFFTNSGSEAVDTALKMALAYHRARRGLADPPDRPYQRLSRRRLRRRLGGRHAEQSQGLRPAAARRRPPALPL